MTKEILTAENLLKKSMQAYMFDRGSIVILREWVEEYIASHSAEVEELKKQIEKLSMFETERVKKIQQQLKEANKLDKLAEEHIISLQNQLKSSQDDVAKVSHQANALSFACDEYKIRLDSSIPKDKLQEVIKDLRVPKTMIKEQTNEKDYIRGFNKALDLLEKELLQDDSQICKCGHMKGSHVKFENRKESGCYGLFKEGKICRCHKFEPSKSKEVKE